MKTLNKKHQLIVINSLGIICLLLLLMFLPSCNKDFPNTLRTEYPGDTTDIKEGKRKVLYLILDGVRGNAVSSLLPKNISLVARNSIYTYDGLSDYQANTITNAAGWANMTTGVNGEKHKITSESFTGSDLVSYPTLFTRLKAANPRYRTISIAVSTAFNTNLAIDATEKQTLTTDLAVKDALISELKTKDADLIVGQFHSAEVEGAANGYETTNTAYTAAITTLDGYIGNIMNELKARPNFIKENWLVVIASNKGGVAVTLPGSSDLGAYGDPTRNNFIIYYNPKFSTQPLSRPDANSFPYVGFGPRFQATTTSSGSATLNNTAIGNFGTTGEFTFMFKMRNDASSPNYYPAFLGKRANFNSVDGLGWGFLFGADDYQLDWGGSPRPGGGKVRDGVWHSIAFKIFTLSGTRYLALFTDGVKKTANLNINSKNVNNSAALRIGANLAGNDSELTNIIIKDVALFNVAMSDAELSTNMRKELTNLNPFFGNLIGWWPGNEASGNTIVDFSGKGNNFITNADVTRASFEDLSPNVSPLISTASYRVVINSVDIPTQIYQWMGIAPTANWKLDGKVWKLLYTDVRNN
ncbi:DUF4983 domain-containing protein [Pedobacter polaris]|uniref:DUF4983 domain-containing protein n=1 Tax=Pedobacter polaris TaxID=2571273 RepID=A0A4U1CUW2_9SPHI|nr:DUF4983 domain-containing protein [Pedobacter polaris]TKC09939.1 DUF4983 domain-containing protein [Pedobacter polaris]